MKHLVIYLMVVLMILVLAPSTFSGEYGETASWGFEKLDKETIVRVFEEDWEEDEDEDDDHEDDEDEDDEDEEDEDEEDEDDDDDDEYDDDEDEDHDDDEDDDHDDDDDEDDEDEDDEEEMEVIRIVTVLDDTGGMKDRVHGTYVKIVSGVVGNAIQLDGNTSYIVREADKAPQVSDDFSVGAWIAIGAYPTHWCPVADHSTKSGKGYFLGIDALGHAGFKLSAGGDWHEVVSEERIPLRKWTHIGGTYSPDEGMVLYVDGKAVASREVAPLFAPAEDADMLIGRHSIKRKPHGTIRPHATAQVYTFYDGLIDELKVLDYAATAEDVASYVSENEPMSKPALSERKLPTGPDGPGRFGAIYTTLKYYDAWDSSWRVGNHADVVVRFDKNACKFIFWRGTSYIPHWITENGIWYDNEFNETWSEKGCHEPMSDKRCHFSHVRIIENNDARVVVHWRYALVDNWYGMAKVDELTGWGDWTDEVYTIYPDCVAVRKVTLHSSQPRSPHEWHEAIIVMGPGQRPEQVLHPEALILANMQGQSHTYSWRDGAPGEDGDATEPDEANIHLVNTKSTWKPLVIVSPDSEPAFDIYAGELRRDVSIFPWWNHWPTAQKPCDGRYAMDSDLASHSSLSHCYWKAYEETETSMTKIMLNGLTTKSATELIPLAQSWSNPAKLKVKKGLFGTSFKSQGYDPTERAYHLVNNQKQKASTLEMEIAADKDSPLVNPAFVIKGWGSKDASVKVNGKKLKRGEKVRIGHRDRLEGTDLIIWIEAEMVKPTKISVSPM